MTDFLFQIALSNACFSLILAIVAMGVIRDPGARQAAFVPYGPADDTLDPL